MRAPDSRARGVGGRRVARLAALAALLPLAIACTDPDTIAVPDREGAVKSTAAVRADRRAYDGAPPTIPHDSYGAVCTACHDRHGQAVGSVGFAPPSPHEGTARAGAMQRCRQCHVFRTTDELFVASSFEGLAQALVEGDRASAGAPPRIPHRILMRENCVACHDGPGAREEIRTSHPERWRCRQCHVPVAAAGAFVSELGSGLTTPESP